MKKIFSILFVVTILFSCINRGPNLSKKINMLNTPVTIYNIKLRDGNNSNYKLILKDGNETLHTFEGNDVLMESIIINYRIKDTLLTHNSTITTPDTISAIQTESINTTVDKPADEPTFNDNW